MNQSDPMLGGTFTQIAVGKGGSVDFKPSQLGEVNQFVDEYGRLVNKNPVAPNRPAPVQQAPTEQAPQRQLLNRRMVIVGYKGAAEAWLRTFDKLFKARGGQTDRSMYLAFDPRDENFRDALMEAGARTFEKFVLIPYRYSLPQNRLGLPAPKNLDALMGMVQEEYFNGGPALLAIPFHTLHGTPFDQIENHYKMSKTPFLGYEVRKTVQGQKVRIPGAILVLPPGWVSHPNYTLKKGLSASGGTDIYFMRDEILRDMRSCEQICGSGQQPSSFACIQGFDQNEAFGPETIADPNARPAGVKAVGVPLPPGALIVNDGLERAVRPVTEETIKAAVEATGVPVVTITPPVAIAKDPVVHNREYLLDAIKQVGFNNMKGELKESYAYWVSNDDDFFDLAQKAIHAHKIASGKAKKKAVAAIAK